MNVHFSSVSVEWPTPSSVYSKLNDEFRFDFDPCPIGGNQDGLSTLFTSWVGKRVFCNPPYGRGVGKWIERGLEADCAVFLLPARTDTQWFHDLVLPNAREVRFIRGRLRFGGAETGAPFPSMIIVLKDS